MEMEGVLLKIDNEKEETTYSGFCNFVFGFHKYWWMWIKNENWRPIVYTKYDILVFYIL